MNADDALNRLKYIQNVLLGEIVVSMLSLESKLICPYTENPAEAE